MRRFILLPFLLVVCSFAYSQDPDPKATDWQPQFSSDLSFLWSTPTIARSQVSRGGPMVFEIHTKIIILAAPEPADGATSSEPDQAPDKGANHSEPVLDSGRRPAPTTIERQEGYHDLPYHDLPEHPISYRSRTSPETSFCAAGGPRGWCAQDNPDLVWQDHSLVATKGKALNLILDRHDVTEASLGGIPLVVVRTRTGQTAIKTNRRLLPGRFVLAIQSERLETIELTVGDQQTFSDSARLNDAEGSSRSRARAYRPSISPSAVSMTTPRSRNAPALVFPASPYSTIFVEALLSAQISAL